MSVAYMSMGIYVKPSEVADALGVRVQRVYRMCQQGQIPHIRVGRTVRIPRSAWEEFLANQSAAALAAVGGRDAKPV